MTYEQLALPLLDKIKIEMSGIEEFFRQDSNRPAGYPFPPSYKMPHHISVYYSKRDSINMDLRNWYETLMDQELQLILADPDPMAILAHQNKLTALLTRIEKMQTVKHVSSKAYHQSLITCYVQYEDKKSKELLLRRYQILRCQEHKIVISQLKKDSRAMLQIPPSMFASLSASTSSSSSSSSSSSHGLPTQATSAMVTSIDLNEDLPPSFEESQRTSR